MAIKHEVMKQHGHLVQHPFEEDLSFSVWDDFYRKACFRRMKDVHSRHVCIFAEGEVDRSPTGTGCQWEVALAMYAKGEISTEETHHN